MEKQTKRVKGFSNNGVQWEGQKDFDTTYKSIEIRDRVKKTGEGEHDFIVEKVVIVTETPIQEVVDADAMSVGVDNIIKQVLRTGDTSLLPVDNGKCDVDMTGAPETLMELKQMGIDAEKKFAALPNDLTKGQNMVDFVKNMSQESFDSFIKAVNDRLTKEKEGKDNE